MNKSEIKLLEFVREIAKQTPEKPDYWSSCGQCERNANQAEDLIEEIDRAPTSADSQERETELPPLPTHAGRMPWDWLRFGKPGYTVDQMRDYARAALAAPKQPIPSNSGELKDHVIAHLVNRLRDVAIRFHDTQQLRERIAGILVPALKAGRADHIGDADEMVTPSTHSADVSKKGAEIDRNVEDLRAMLHDRAAVGLKKYGVTTCNSPLELRDWLQHALEETLDNAVYLRAAMRKLDDSAEMTDTQISEIFDGMGGYSAFTKTFGYMQFARAVLAAAQGEKK